MQKVARKEKKVARNTRSCQKVAERLVDRILLAVGLGIPVYQHAIFMLFDTWNVKKINTIETLNSVN